MHSDDHDSSRRKLIKGAAATFAAGMVLPGFAQAADADATPQAAMEVALAEAYGRA